MRKRTITLTLAALMVVLTGCGDGDDRAAADLILDRFESQGYDIPASSVTAFRVALDDDADVQQLVRLEQGAAAATARIARDPAAIADVMLAICAYTIEKRQYDAASSALEAYLRSSPGDRHHLWGTSFATRALLVLKGLPDGSGGYGEYDDAAINRALTGR